MPRTPVRVRRRTAGAVTATAAALVLGLVGCGRSDAATTEPRTSDSPSATTTTATGVLDIRDPWVKAADQGMTAAFGTLVNPGDTDVTITAATTDVSPMELHEMAMKDGQMVMRPKPGGIVVKAHTSTVLQPGGDHLMLMDLNRPVRAGDELTFTLTFADGRSQTFTAVAKPFTGAQESYDPSGGAPAAHPAPTPTTNPAPAS